MNQQHWIVFAKDDGIKNLACLFEAEIREIMGDISTSAQTKVVEIARQLMYMDRVKMDDSLSMDAEKPPAETEGPRKINHLDCTIDLEKVEPLLAFPLVELSPECKKCQCFTCSRLFGCTICSSNTLGSCLKVCCGIVAIEHCEEREPWTAELILRNEG